MKFPKLPVLVTHLTSAGICVYRHEWLTLVWVIIASIYAYGCYKSVNSKE